MAVRSDDLDDNLGTQRTGFWESFIRAEVFPLSSIWHGLGIFHICTGYSSMYLLISDCFGGIGGGILV